MRGRAAAVAFVLAVAWASEARAEGSPDEIVLRDGARVRGRVEEIAPGASVRIEEGGATRVLRWAEIDHVERHADAPSPLVASGQPPGSAGDVVHLKGGRPLRGTIVEISPGYYARVELADGSIAMVPWSEVDRLDRAPAAPRAAPTPVEERSRWYGWQTLTADAACIAIAIPTKGYGLLGLLVDGPLVHLAHANPGRAGLDLLLRVGVPLGLGLVGAAIGAGIDDGHESDVPAAAVLGGFGVLIGAGIAVALDAAALAYEDVPTETARLRVGPLVSPSPRGAGAIAGIGGRF